MLLLCSLVELGACLVSGIGSCKRGVARVSPFLSLKDKERLLTLFQRHPQGQAHLGCHAAKWHILGVRAGPFAEDRNWLESAGVALASSIILRAKATRAAALRVST